MTKKEAIRQLDRALRLIAEADEILEEIQIDAYDRDYEIIDGWEAISTIDGILQDFRFHRLQKVLAFVKRWAETGNKPKTDPYFDVY